PAASSHTAAAGSETRPSSRPRPRTAATKTPSKSASRTRFLQAVGNFNPNILGSPPSMTPKNVSQAAPGVSPIISSSRNLSPRTPIKKERRLVLSETNRKGEGINAVDGLDIKLLC
uniref:Uncharacterized protein n=1 Tax=Aegilops tauschii subsp. strangulata TaxID=200361 RepID=A0A452Z479_AEGTS